MDNLIHKYDACGAHLSFKILLSIYGKYIEEDNGAEFDWSQITLESHPRHKATLNAEAIAVQRDSDQLGVLKRLWDRIQWTTDLGFDDKQVLVHLPNDTFVLIRNVWA